MAFVIVVLAAAAAAIVRIAVLQRRVRTLQHEAVIDPLTGAFNRRQMYAALAAARERCHRTGEPAAILAFDVDRFKDVNDVFGHAEGDRVLRSLVSLVWQRFRKLDVLFRSGGEEFILLLSGTAFSDAFGVADELRTRVLEAGLIPDWQFSISIGVAELSLEQSVEAWLEEADAALFRAKRAGRNRVAGRAAAGRDEPATTVRIPVRIARSF